MSLLLIISFETLVLPRRLAEPSLGQSACGMGSQQLEFEIASMLMSPFLGAPGHGTCRIPGLMPIRPAPGPR
jgi:hypothetical protein